MSDMDRGAFIKNGYTVEPGDGGSFIVAQGGMRFRETGRIGEMRGFTSWSDLIAWLSVEHSINAADDFGGKVSQARGDK